MVTLVVKGLARRRPKCLVVLLIGGPLPAILKCGDDLRLSASGMAMNQRLAVIGLRNRQARSLVVAANGGREFGSAHDSEPVSITGNCRNHSSASSSTMIVRLPILRPTSRFCSQAAVHASATVSAHAISEPLAKSLQAVAMKSSSMSAI